MPDALLRNLRAQGRRLTRPRKAILALLREAEFPMSASEVHARLKEAGSPADLVTVYRTLSVLREIGAVSQVEFQEGQFRYEMRQGRQHHHHIRCRACGRIVDLMICPIQKLKTAVERETRYLVEGHSLELVGLCPTCR